MRAKILQMKKLFFVTSILVTFVLGSCSGQQGNAITLKFNLPKGSSYDYNMDMDMSVKGNAGGQAVDVTNTMGMGYRFVALDDSAGWKKLSSTISRIAMNINAGGMKINYDSDKPADTSDVVSGTMGKVLGAMKGGQFTFTMNERGQIGTVSGIDAMKSKMMAAAPDADASGMGGAFNEDNFKQNIQQAFGAYPDKPVKPGDSWTNSITSNTNGMSMKIDNTYTLESVNGNTADVKIDSKITSPTASSGLDITGTMTGTMEYDIPTGVPVGGDYDMKMNMNVSNAGQSTPMTTNIKMKITGKKS